MNWFVGSTFNIWWNFLRKNPQLFLPRNWMKVLFTSIYTLRNTRLIKKEKQIIKDINLNFIKLSDPIFIIGHWRSGTSHLHNILKNDANFNYPTLLQVTFPNTFLTIQKRAKFSQKDNLRPMDNMKVTMDTPGEDEVAVWTMCGISSIGNRLLKTKEKFYDKYLIFNEANETDFNIWQANFIYFLKKISFNDNRRLLLKSPEHTARINILLDIFPNAKFINIHRNPIAVFQSTKHLYEMVIKPSYYEHVDDEHLENRIIKIYKDLYSSYFENIGLIPKNNFVDTSFEDLSNSPIKVVKKIYSELELELTNDTIDRMQLYLDSVKDYSQNEYSAIDEQQKDKICQEWEMCFKYWSYKC